MTQCRIGLALLAAGNALFIAGIAVGDATTGEALSLSGASLMLWGIVYTLATMPRDR